MLNGPKLKLTGKKTGMSQIFQEDGEVTPVTVLDLNSSQNLSLNQVFQIGEKVQVTGTSKGKGFAGVVKRHGFAGGPKTHGQSDRHRAPGSIGAGTDPGRVWKGQKMAGRMGGQQVTVKGLKIMALDEKRKLVQLKGAVPGQRNSVVLLKKQAQLK